MEDIDYNGILSELASNETETIIQFLCDVLPYEWCEKYREMTPTATNILQFNNKGFEFLFDFSSELVSKGFVTSDQAVEDRVVAVFGRSVQTCIKRDASRIRGFLGGSMHDLKKGSTDKGHFIGHALGGGLYINLFPQRKDINRGWSKRGKVFRAMERHCSKNPGTFCFSRPIYGDCSWRPCMIEYGLLTKTGIWVEIFDN